MVRKLSRRWWLVARSIRGFVRVIVGIWHFRGQGILDLRSDELADYLESLPKDEQERIKKSLDNKDKDDKTDKEDNNEKDTNKADVTSSNEKK